ncbi:MAG: amine oxidase [Corynebacteriales bacterium]|nr:amine oxidase [Mycobacteriales bacterium]
MGTSGDESETERLNRNFAEILQEIRVAQTGVQILFAFLLTIPFTLRFETTDGFQQGVYLTTLLLTVGATGLLVGPVAYHRLTSGRKMRPQLITTANRLALGGIGVLVLALCACVLLITDMVLGLGWAIAIASLTAIWLISVWYVIPLAHRKEHFETNGLKK